MRSVVLVVHLSAWAVCYGSLVYTYYRLNPQMREFFASGYEAFAAEAAVGLHRWMAAMLAVAALTGAALVLLDPAPSRPTIWWTLMAAKSAVLAAAVSLQVWMARVMWPRRRRAAADAALERRFFRVAFALGFLLILQLVLGTLAGLAASS